MDLEITAWPPLTNILWCCLIVLSVGMVAYLMQKLNPRMRVLEGARRTRTFPRRDWS